MFSASPFAIYLNHFRRAGIFCLALMMVLCMAQPACAADLVTSAALMSAKNFSLAAWLGVEPSLTAGTFLGIITASFIYLLSSWFAVRDRSQIFLMLMLLCLITHMAAASGYLDKLHNNAFFIHWIEQSSMILFYLFSSIFTVLFLELDAIQSRVRYVLYSANAVLVLSLVIAAVDLGFITHFLPYLGLGILLTILVAGGVGWFKEISGSFAHLMAFSVVFLGTLSTLPIEWTAIGLPPVGGDISAVSYALCAMLFAVVIASQFARRQEIKERELETSNERFRMAALGSNEGLYDWDFMRKEGYFSDRLRRIFGLALGSQKNVLKAWFKLINPEDRRMVRQTLFGFLRNTKETALTIDYRITRPDKRMVWVSTTGVAVRNTNGKVVRLVGSVGDVTEKKRAEARLKASETRFRSIAEAHPVPVLIATLKEGEILYASNGTVQVLGMELDNLIGMSLDSFFVDGEARKQLMRDVNRDNSVDLRECLLQRADHSTFYAAVSARVINYERRPCAVFGINDITEKKDAENKIREQEGALQQSEKLAALGGLLAGVAHELNNPLSVIVGQAVLMRESAKDEKITSRADKIHKAGERCARIIKSFLALARRKPPERKAVSINEIIENSIELLAFQLRTDNIELIRNLGTNLPSALADGDQMTQVITNLVMNAKQVLQDKDGKRTITIETWLAPEKNSVSNETLYVAVTDNGTGVPKEIATRIFEPFFTTKPAGAGTGVGLSLCHNIVEGHSGRIWVEDAENGGARFIFTLPAYMHEAVSESQTTDTRSYCVSPRKILIVDDEVELGQTLADILQPDGHEIILVDNGQKALNFLEKENVDVIISDLRMPVLDGPGLYRALEKYKPHYLSRIIFVTGDTLSIPVRDFLAHYALDVIEKPYSPADVRKGLYRLVQEQKSSNPQSNTGATEMNI